MAVNEITLLRQSMNAQGALQQPWTTGVHKLSDPERFLFYKRQDGSYNRIELGSIDAQSDVEDLANACLPATFGRNDEDVLDEDYRKAGKMDYGDFSWPFHPESHGQLISKLVSGLFPFDCLEHGIRFETYKLNVYGEGSFFKSHVDTPRGENMFGSLVVILPLGNHQGGDFLLRHKSKEHCFDSNTLLANAESPSIAYVAFFSDVEHEVLQVTQGYRVSITYNLYYSDATSIPKPLVPTQVEVEHPFEVALKHCLEDPTFKNRHGRLGFGLQYMYPRNMSEVVDLKDDSEDTEVEAMHQLFEGKQRMYALSSNLQEYNDRCNRKKQERLLQRKKYEEEQGLVHELLFLKGVDATIARICTKLGLKVDLNYAYSPVNENGYEELYIISPHLLCPDPYNITVDELELCLKCVSSNVCVAWKEGFGPKHEDENKLAVDKHKDLADKDESGDKDEAEEGHNADKYSKYDLMNKTMKLTWVVDPTVSRIRRKTSYMAFGNESTLAYLYYNLCLVVDLEYKE